LKDVSFSILPGTHVGVVGRTGAGKSTLIGALFRLVELTSGRILVDNVDISTIDIREVRKRLSVIPQDPVVFSGSWRNNLDAYADRTDAEIMSALECVGLTACADLDETMPQLSQGERQLVCIARALLRQSTIVVSDESTASIDTATDGLLQSMFKRELRGRTSITIAHRLQTVMGSDTIFFMSQGEIAEMDSPASLVKKPSQFRSLVMETGHSSSQYLIGLANSSVVTKVESKVEEEDPIDIEWTLYSKGI
jgi:ABC-type multidrug transport system fused ATPase/permease subunit